jgi:hypothetical protein
MPVSSSPANLKQSAVALRSEIDAIRGRWNRKKR